MNLTLRDDDEWVHASAVRGGVEGRDRRPSTRVQPGGDEPADDGGA